MDRTSASELPHIDASLDPVRAAIRMVADGDARRVTIHVPGLGQILPAARQLARAAGVSVELIGTSATGRDLVVLPLGPYGA
jgi:2-keto-3-deoxy-galactonokinase